MGSSEICEDHAFRRNALCCSSRCFLHLTPKKKTQTVPMERQKIFNLIFYLRNVPLEQNEEPLPGFSLLVFVPAEQFMGSSEICEDQAFRRNALCYSSSKMRQRKEEFAGGGGGPEHLSAGNDYIDPSENIKQEPIRVEKAPGRNDPCPCGSGKKYKHCHGKEL